MQHFLLELLHTNPFLSHLDFSRRQFTIIDPPSLQLLTRFTELRRIDLSENLIRHLPQDLSLLVNIVEFDLNGNPLEDLETAVDSLAQMPSLRRLRINLHEEEQVDYLLRNLENLEELNGLSVEREALFNDEEQQEEMYQMDGGNTQVMQGESMIEQSYNNAIQEEGLEEDDDFMHPNNMVLEESNEDGTMSNENPASGGRHHFQQRVQQHQQPMFYHQEDDSFATGFYPQQQLQQEQQQPEDDDGIIAEEEEYDCEAVAEESQQLQKSMNSMMITKHQNRQIDEEDDSKIENTQQQQTNNLETSSVFEALNQSNATQNDNSVHTINDEGSELKQSDLENIAMIYESIRQQLVKVEHNIDQRMADDFNANLQNVMQILSNNLQEISELNQHQQSGQLSDSQKMAFDNQLATMKKRVILSTKKALISICYDKALYYLRTISNEPLCQQLYETFSQLQLNEQKLFDSSLKLLSHSVTEQIQFLLNSTTQQQQLAPSKNDFENSAEQLQQLRAQLQQKEKIIQQLQSQVQGSKKEIEEVVEAADVMEKEYARKQTELEKEVKEVRDHNSNLEEENKRILETLVRHSKSKAANMGITTGGDIVRSGSSSSITQTSRMPLSFQQQASNQNITSSQPTSIKNSNAQLPQKLNTIYNQNSTQQSQATLVNHNYMNGNNNMSQPNLLAPSIHTQQSSINTPLPGPPSQAKILPLKQLKDIISDMEQQKIKYDSKCRDSGLPIETMEQFMYTYLNQKYGLKSLIIEWASTIIHSIKVYLRDDHQVTLFAKILKNECDEEFRFIQTHVRDTLGNLLKILLREKYHLKSEAEIASICEHIQTSSQGVIEDIYWKKIVNKMYDRDDVATLTSRFMECIHARKQLGQVSHNSSIMTMVPSGPLSMKENKGSQNSTMIMPLRPTKLTREDEVKLKKQQKTNGKLLYADFVKVILDFQLQEHEKFLNSFTSLFKEIDSDGNGILNEEEFRDLLTRMNQVTQTCSLQEQLTEHLDTLLSIVDPHNNKQMTYSEIVQLLSSQMSPISDENPRMVPLLEKFVNQIQIMRGLQDPNAQYLQNQHQEEELDDEQHLQDKYFEMFGGAAIVNSSSTENRFSDHPIADIRSHENNWVVDTHGAGRANNRVGGGFNSDLDMVSSTNGMLKQQKY